MSTAEDEDEEQQEEQEEENELLEEQEQELEEQELDEQEELEELLLGPAPKSQSKLAPESVLDGSVASIVYPDMALLNCTSTLVTALAASLHLKNQWEAPVARSVEPSHAMASASKYPPDWKFTELPV